MSIPSDDPSAQELDPLISERAGMDSFLPLLEIYVAGLADQMGRMDQAIAEGNDHDLRTQVHQMRGTGGGYGYPDLTRVASLCEEALVAVGPGGAKDSSVLAAVEDLRILVRRANLGLGQI